MNEMQWDSRGTKRKMRKADQFRFNEETRYFEIYQIDIPAELEEWEKEGLKKQAEMRKARNQKKKAKMDVNGSESDDGRDSDISD